MISLAKLPPRVRNILDAAARKHGVLAEDIIARNRRLPVVAARVESIARIRRELRFSLPHIGRLLGLHHTTVLRHLPPALRATPGPIDWSIPDESGVWPYDLAGESRGETEMTAVPLNGETWVICGGRDFTDLEMFDRAIYDILTLRGCPSRIIHGGASGADKMAGEWAKRMAIGCVAVMADWAVYGQGAGPKRNQLMLDTYKPSVVVAFPGGNGTADMVRRSRKAGADVIEIQPHAQAPGPVRGEK